MKNYPRTAAAAKLLQSCPTLCDPIDSSPPGSPIPGILQARTLEWGAVSFSNAWKWNVKVKSFSRVQLLVTPWTAAYEAPPSMGFSRQEYWSGVPLPSPSILALEMTYFIMGMLPESIKNLPESGNRVNQCMPRGRIFIRSCVERNSSVEMTNGTPVITVLRLRYHSHDQRALSKRTKLFQAS